MAARIVLGDPEIESAFEQTTHVRLDKQEKPVFVVCTAPSVTTNQYETLSVDIPDEVRRRMRRKNIPTGDPADALNAAADAGGRFSARDIAKNLDDGYLMHVDFERYSLSEDGGNTLFRGRATGSVSIYEVVDEEDGGVTATEVFRRGFQTTYPPSHPVPSDRTPEKVFRKRFSGHLADQLGRMVYRYRASD